MRTLLGALLVVAWAAQVQAQNPCIDPLTTAPQLTTAAPVHLTSELRDLSDVTGYELGWFTALPEWAPEQGTTPSHVFPIALGAVSAVPTAPTCYTFAGPPPPAAGTYYAGLRALGAPSMAEGPPVASLWTFTTTAVPVTVSEPPPPPVCADIPSVFITRWEMTTGRPGSRMRVNYQLASVSPIVELQAKIDGATVAAIAGTDLTATGGVWMTTPPIGLYKLQVSVKNAAGCTKDVFSLIDLQVK